MQHCRAGPREPQRGLRVTVASLGITVFPSPGLAQWLSLNSWPRFSSQSLALPLPPLATLGISQEVFTMDLLLIEEDQNSLGLQTGRGGGWGEWERRWAEPVTVLGAHFLEGNSSSLVLLTYSPALPLPVQVPPHAPCPWPPRYLHSQLTALVSLCWRMDGSGSQNHSACSQTE